MKSNGAIISGYQGIGKSTLVNEHLYVENMFIDLESSNFFIEDSNGEKVREENWYKAYGNLAISLAEQGYNVFISSHKVVRDYLSSIAKSRDIKLLLIFPTEELQEPWIRKLLGRYITTCSEKDYKAYMGAKTYYLDNIKNLREQEGWKKLEIGSMDYDLYSLIYDWRIGEK